MRATSAARAKGRIPGHCEGMVGHDDSGKISAKVARLAADERGAMLPLVAIFLAAMLGLAFLMVDLSRFLNLQTQLQKAADAFALAAAAELDGQPAVGARGSAIDRANLAIDSMLAGLNASRWGFTPAVRVASRRYLSALPASDATPIGGAAVTNDPREARFVEIVVEPDSIRPAISARIVGAQVDTLTTSAVAVAGFTETVCRLTPIYICNPVEDQGRSIWDAAADPDFRRKELMLKRGAGTPTDCPGNFGYLAVNAPGANVLRDALMAVNPGVCYQRSGVTTEPGNIASASDALNTRFDIYRGSAGNEDVPPDVNVRKGYSGDRKYPEDCFNGATEPDYCPSRLDSPRCQFRGLTRDLGTDSTTMCGTTIGNGVWDFDGYWQVNHGGTAPNGWSNANLPSRYDVYQWEVDHEELLDNQSGEAPPRCRTRESGRPTTRAGLPGRRIINVAIINCRAYADRFNGRQTDVPVEAYASFFLTRPVGPDNTIYAELLRIVRPGDGSGVVHDDVQLYR